MKNLHWINVKDRLPDKNDKYLIIHKDITEQYNMIDFAYFTKSYCNEINANSFYFETKFGIKPVRNVTFWIDKKDIDVPEEVIING